MPGYVGPIIEAEEKVMRYAAEQDQGWDVRAAFHENLQQAREFGPAASFPEALTQAVKTTQGEIREAAEQQAKAFDESLWRMDHLHREYVKRHPEISAAEDERLTYRIGAKELQAHGSSRDGPAITAAVDAFKEQRHADRLEHESYSGEMQWAQQKHELDQRFDQGREAMREHLDAGLNDWRQFINERNVHGPTPDLERLAVHNLAIKASDELAHGTFPYTLADRHIATSEHVTGMRKAIMDWSHEHNHELRMQLNQAETQQRLGKQYQDLDQPIWTAPRMRMGM